MSRVLVLQHIECEDLGGMEKSLEDNGIKYNYIPLYAGAKIPQKIEDYSGIIILGGPMNVYEEKKYPFLIEEDKLIKKALKKDLPILGICLGGQLIAKASGAKVLTGHRKEIGWFNVQLTEEGTKDPLFSGLPKKFKVFQWHSDTFNIPSNAKKLASSEIFPNQAFRLGKSYGIQFHIEVMDSTIYNWLEEYEKETEELEYVDPQKIRRDTRKHIKELYRLADKVYANFIEMLQPTE